MAIRFAWGTIFASLRVSIHVQSRLYCIAQYLYVQVQLWCHYMYMYIAPQFDTQLQVLQGHVLISHANPNLKNRGGGTKTSDLKTGTFPDSHTPPCLNRHPCTVKFVTTVLCVWLSGMSHKVWLHEIRHRLHNQGTVSGLKRLCR